MASLRELTKSCLMTGCCAHSSPRMVAKDHTMLTSAWQENLCSTVLRKADRCARSRREYSALSMVLALTAMATRNAHTLPGGPHRPSKLASLERACATAQMLLDRACRHGWEAGQGRRKGKRAQQVQEQVASGRSFRVVQRGGSQQGQAYLGVKQAAGLVAVQHLRHLRHDG